MTELSREAVRQARAYISPHAHLLIRQVVLLGTALVALVGAAIFVLFAVTVALAQELGLVAALLLMALILSVIGFVAFLLSRRPPRRVIVPPIDATPRYPPGYGIGSMIASTVIAEVLAPGRRRGLVLPAIAALGTAFLVSRGKSRRRRR